jgi:uncharacterized protein YacL (UPF0231 family)
LTKTVENIIIEDSGEPLRKCIAELEVENSQLKATGVESAKTITTLQRSVDARVEDYNLWMEGNKSLLAEHNELRYHSDDLESDLAKVRSSAESITGLEAKIRSAEAHSVDLATAGESA